MHTSPSDTPWAAGQPQRFHYAPRDAMPPAEVAIVTDARGRTADWDALARSLRGQSLQCWRWLILCDPGAADLPSGLVHDPRVQLISSAAAVPPCAYVCTLDPETTLAPTFLEKCVWLLASNPGAMFCNTHSIAGDDPERVWEYGFEQGARFLDENFAGATAVFRWEAYLAAVDDAPSTPFAAWERWLRLAAADMWGHTIPEALIRYPRIDRAAPFRPADPPGAEEFRAGLRARYGHLRGSFPAVRPALHEPYAPLPEEAPLCNPLAKPAGVRRLLILMPWLIVGGAERVNLDLARFLAGPGAYEISIVTTLPAHHAWAAEFARLTPDIFLLDRLLPPIDYARFLAYLVESRQIDIVLISNSYAGYLLLPYLRARHPGVTFVDLCHSFEESWKSGGYPRCGAAYQELLDLNITSSEYVKRWMVARGAQAERIAVCYTNIDTEKWRPDPQARQRLRQALGLAEEQLLVVFHGRLSLEKRPVLMARIMARLREEVGDAFRCLVIGDGPERPSLEQEIRALGLESHVRLVGRLGDAALHEHLAAADVLILPSQVEGISVSTFEAMAMGVVPVSADVGGQGELVTADCGFLVPHGPDELDAYVAALRRLVLDPALRRALGRQARRRVEEHFPLSAFGPRMAALFERAAALHRDEPRPAVSLALAREHAVQAIETMRLEQAVGELWADRDRWRRLAEAG
ncbi:MAG TPA: glycosyltransferase family 4 protein, partial [Roseiflexaceae bacterium]|nr:glycosyltransferase family 4 protein [Roseiflexaceae bacterium]